MKRALVIFLTFILSAACTMPETKIYSLNTDGLPSEKTVKSEFSGKSVTVIVNAPRHLSQPYIVYRNSPYQMEISKYSKWEASPQDMLKKVVRESLSASGTFREARASNAVPEGFYTIEIELKNFERYDSEKGSEGRILLDFVLLSPEGSALIRNSVQKNVGLDERSFLSLAKGMSVTVSETVKEIKASIEGFGGRP